jgi:LPS-assembly lipoprotein
MAGVSRRRLLAGLALLAGGAPLAACRVQPLYGTVNPVGPLDTYRASDDLNAIDIAPIGGRLGQQIYNALRNEMLPGGLPAQPAYRLQVQASEQIGSALLQSDATATRETLSITISYGLSVAATGVPLVGSTATTFAAYNVTDSEYATYRAEVQARERGVEELAVRVRQRLASWFVQARADGTLARKLYIGE